MIVAPENIKNIIFDFGGVILNIDHDLTTKGFIDLGVADFEEKYSQLVQTDLFDNFETGRITPEEFRKKIRTYIPGTVSGRQIDKAWNAMLMDIPRERIIFLENIRKKYRTFLLSNTNAIHYDIYLKDLQKKYGYGSFSDLFEGVYFSFQVGMRKPDMKIFEFVLKENDLDPAETLYIDDSTQHVEGAKKAGLITCFLEKDRSVLEIF